MHDHLPQATHSPHTDDANTRAGGATPPGDTHLYPGDPVERFVDFGQLEEIPHGILALLDAPFCALGQAWDGSAGREKSARRLGEGGRVVGSALMEGARPLPRLAEAHCQATQVTQATRSEGPNERNNRRNGGGRRAPSRSGCTLAPGVEAANVVSSTRTRLLLTVVLVVVDTRTRPRACRMIHRWGARGRTGGRCGVSGVQGSAERRVLAL